MASERATPRAPEDWARQNFGQRAAFYATSASHTDPQVLARVLELACPDPATPVASALDVATGTGHTAFALAARASAVIGIDLTPEMLHLARARAAELRLAHVTFQIADVLALPFTAHAFNVVTCRRAAHHFTDIKRALSEMRRVLRPGGRLVIDDRSVPEDDFVDRAMNELDTLHDESHIRQYRPNEWVRMLAGAGFTVETVEPYTRYRPLNSLTEGVSPETCARIHAIVAALTPEQRLKLNVSDVGGVTQINHWYVMLAAVRR
jgi:ubiquinone/menaquinone biosynthesis C-methylase UbiE